MKRAGCSKSSWFEAVPDQGRFTAGPNPEVLEASSSAGKRRLTGTTFRGSTVDQIHSFFLAVRTIIPRLRSKSKDNSQKPRIIRSESECEAGIAAKTMKAQHLFLAIAALLAAGGLWFAWSAWRTPASPKSSMGVGFKTPDGPPKPGQMLRPPDPTRRFADFTPEQRVEFARKGHGPGG